MLTHSQTFQWKSPCSHLHSSSPDVNVMCVFSEDCLLPCSFQPGSNETIEWFRQDVIVYKYFNHQEYFNHDHLSGRAHVFQPLLSRGNATLMLRRSVLKDRGMYRCHVNSSAGEHNAKVILKIEGEFRFDVTTRYLMIPDAVLCKRITPYVFRVCFKGVRLLVVLSNSTPGCTSAALSFVFSTLYLTVFGAMFWFFFLF